MRPAAKVGRPATTNSTPNPTSRRSPPKRSAQPRSGSKLMTSAHAASTTAPSPTSPAPTHATGSLADVRVISAAIRPAKTRKVSTAITAATGRSREGSGGSISAGSGTARTLAQAAAARLAPFSGTMRLVGEATNSFQRLRQVPALGRVLDWGLGPAAVSDETLKAGARVAGLKATESVCPYCAVGCGQIVYTRNGELVDIEGNPRSPINQGTLCPKGSASRQLVQQPGRLTKVLYRAPHATEWRELDLEVAMDMIAERVIAAREDGWQDVDHRGHRVDRTLGFAHLGGATLDNEENYLIKKSFTAMGAVQIENQARI